MHYFSINLIFVIILFAAFWGVIGYLIYLLIKALRNEKVYTLRAGEA